MAKRKPVRSINIDEIDELTYRLSREEITPVEFSIRLRQVKHLFTPTYVIMWHIIVEFLHELVMPIVSRVRSIFGRPGSKRR